MKKQTIAFIALLLVFASFLTACSSGQQNNADGKAGSDSTATKPAAMQMTTEPVTLKFLDYKAPLSDDEFKTLIADPVKAKYPNITMELQRLDKGETLETLIASDRVPDIAYAGILNVIDLQTTKLAVDFNPLIKKFNYDLSVYQPATLEMIKKYSDNGELFAMPYSLAFPIMLYNKDIFDRFAVPYPKDGMTWAETTELARRVTREEGGVQYNGFGTQAMGRLSLTMLQPRVDPKTEKAKLQTDGFKQVFEIYKAMWDAAGGNISTAASKRFSEDRTLAMFADFNSSMTALEELNKAGKPLNWDAVTFPSMPNKKLTVDTPLNILFITTLSKHQETAFQVISFLNSKEEQLRLSKAGRPTVLKDEDVKKAYGQDLPSLQGKNVQAGFKYINEPLNRKHTYDDVVTSELNKAATAVVTGKKDINTALRDAEEAANKEIESQMNGG